MGDKFESGSFSILSIKKHSVSSRKWRPLILKNWAFCFFIHGSGKMVINKEEYVINKGDSLILQPGMSIQLSLSDNQSIEGFILHFMIEEKLASKLFSLPLLSKVKSTLTNMSGVLHLLTQLKLYLKPKSYHEFFKQQSLVFDLLSILVDEMETDETGLEKTITYMEKYFKEDIYIGMLSDIAGMTPSSFTKAFKRKMGRTPSDYLIELRMNHAKEILSLPTSTLKEVAQSVGYQDEFYFSRLFKKREGISPTIYMKQNGERIAVVSQMFLQDHLLSLGIQPVAAPSYPGVFKTRNGFPSYLSHRLKGTKALNVENSVPIADILTLSPDIIFKMNLHFDQGTEQLKDHAKTVYIDHRPAWEEYLMEIAGYTGREKEAELIILQMNEKEVIARDSLLSFTKRRKWAIVWAKENDVRLYGRSGHAMTDLLFSRLGFTPDERITHLGYKSNALDELIDINPDNVLFLWSEPRMLERLRMNKRWKELKAIREGRIFCPNSIEWDPWGPLGRVYTIQQCVSYFQQCNVLGK